MQADLIRYSIARAVRPIAASSVVWGRPFKVLMMTLYVEARVSKPVIPIKVGTWPAAMLMADPVMKADIETRGIRSTIRPKRANPIATMMAPAIIAMHPAISAGATFGWVFLALVMIFPTSVDTTATGFGVLAQ